jgi:glutaredoxin
MSIGGSMIVVYSMEGCAQCVQAVKLLERKAVPFKVVKIDEDFEAYEFLKREGHRSMPQIYKDGKLLIQGGYSGLTKLTDEDFEKLK